MLPTPITSSVWGKKLSVTIAVEYGRALLSPFLFRLANVYATIYGYASKDQKYDSTLEKNVVPGEKSPCKGLDCHLFLPNDHLLGF